MLKNTRSTVKIIMDEESEYVQIVDVSEPERESEDGVCKSFNRPLC